MKHDIEAHYDTIVVGGRVAGASTAMLLARAGQRVLVVERSAPGTDTTSTHALMRGGVMQLHRWGILERVIAAGTPPIHRTTFHYGDESIEIEIQERDGVGALYAPRRTVLDAVLCSAAIEAGAHVAHNTTMESLLRADDGCVTGVELRDARGQLRRVEADIVVGADGARSPVARSAGAVTMRTGRHPCAVIYGYWHGLDLGGTHWYYGQDVAAGAIPTNNGATCVFVAMRPARYAAEHGAGLEALFEHALADMDARLSRKVARARRAGKLHPFAGHAGFLRRAWGPGWALVGDAGCFKDPITAHGMTDALRDAEFLARAIVAGGAGALASYEEERDEFAVEFLDLSDEVASFDWNFERAKQLHHRLSKLMAREYDRIRDMNVVGTAERA